MKNIKVGVQMMMLKDKVEEFGVYELLRKVSDLGYRSVEISQIPMTEENVVNLRKASVDFDIDISSCSAALEPMFPGMPGETLVNDFDKIVSDCKTLDCKYLRIGMLPFSMIGDKEKFIGFAKQAEDMAKKLAVHDIELYYHNHHIEFQKLDGQWGLDHIKNNSELLGFELDVHWIQRAGVNPLEIIKAYEGRVNILHLKDYRIGSMDMEAFKTGDMKQIFTSFMNTVEFAELGEGNLDFKAIIDTGIKAGVKHFFIEQDMSYGKDPLESLRISRDHLVDIGYGHLF